jgi:hypothetical protein
VVSTVHEEEAGLGSVLPARSVARTSKVWDPSPRPGCSAGEVQGSKVASSNEHSKVEAASSAAKAKVAEVFLVGSSGRSVMVVSGAVVSTVHEEEAGLGSVFPARSVARTSIVCAPSSSPS